MENRPEEEQQYVDYLLGNCTEEARAELEERFFRNDESFEQLCAAEAELIDEYLRGELNPAERVLFERQSGIPGRQERVLFGRAMRAVIE